MAGSNSIELFQFTQKYCQTFGIFPPQPNQNRYPINSMNWFTLFCLNQFLISSGVFLLFEANSMVEYGLTYFYCSNIVLCDVFSLIAFWQVKNISKFVGDWEEFIEKRKHSRIIYKIANEKIEKVTSLLAYCLLASICLTPTPFLTTIVNYCILDLGDESFILFIPGWFPFDWQTPLGYLFAWLGQFTGVTAIMIIVTPFYNFILGSSFLFISVAEDITKNLTDFNITLKTSEDPDRDRVNLTKRFCAIIRNYSDAKGFVKEFNGICEYLLFSFFVWDLLAVAGSLVSLQFQLWADSSKLMEVSFSLVVVFWTFGLVFLICELGKRVTNKFEECENEFEQCDWNKLLPIELQRMYLIFLLDIQQPVYIRSYGGILCLRETFKNIINKGFSYFMTLREFKI